MKDLSFIASKLDLCFKKVKPHARFISGTCILKATERKTSRIATCSKLRYGHHKESLDHRKVEGLMKYVLGGHTSRVIEKAHFFTRYGCFVT